MIAFFTHMVCGAFQKRLQEKERLLVLSLSSLYWVLYLQAKPGGVGSEGKVSVKRLR